MFLSVMIVVAVTATIIGIIYFIHISNFVSTDDAFINGRISHIAPLLGGLFPSFLMELLIYPIIFYLVKMIRISASSH